MKRLTVIRPVGPAITIEAPKDKEMVIDQSALHDGVLVVGEYGPSGVKIAAFHTWDYATFDAEDHGYKITKA